MSNLFSTETLQRAMTSLKHKISERGDLPHVSVRKQLEYIDALSRFPLGQALLEKRSIDTFWTDFILTANGENERLSPLEEFILTRSPFAIASRELLKNFQNIVQDNLKEDIVLASIPCGSMREVLELDFSSITNFTLIGIDIDQDSLSLASQLAGKTGLASNLKLRQEDAWDLPYSAEIDLITSCGLNIYVSDREKELDLYRQFFNALKPGGKLVIGFLTYPPDEQIDSEWKLNKIHPENLLLEKILYKDILDLQWRNFRTSCEFEIELKKAGFSEISFYYDTLHVFPTVVAKK